MSIRAHTNPARLDQRVTFQRKVETQDADSGNLVADWRTLITCHAAVDGGMAHPQEPDVGGGTKSRRDYTIWIRADVYQRFALTLLDRVKWNDGIFNIKDMPNQQLRGRLIAVIVNAGLNEG